MGTERRSKESKPKREKRPGNEVRRRLRDIVRQRLATIGLEDEITWQIAARLILLSEKELAAVTGYSPRSLQGLRCRGGGPRYRELSPRSIKYVIADILEWYDENPRSSTAG